MDHDDLTPLQVLRAARHEGIEVLLAQGDLRLVARLQPDPRIIHELVAHKPAIIALLTPDASGWTGEDYETFYEERAAILEYEHGVPRHEAEARAREQTNAERTLRLASCPPNGRRSVST